jgi:hypothetical protein
LNVRFPCPCCQRPASLDARGLAEWQCPQCDHLLRVQPPTADDRVEACAVCGNAELYKKKDFPHWLGLSILTSACLGFVVAQGLFWPWVAWGILIASAAVDGLLYLGVRDAIVCYRCGAHHRGCPAGPAHEPFELGVAERYRQERLRRARLQAQKENP